MINTAKQPSINTSLITRRVLPYCEPFIMTNEELRSSSPSNDIGAYTSITSTPEGNLIRCYVAASVME